MAFPTARPGSPGRAVAFSVLLALAGWLGTAAPAVAQGGPLRGQVVERGTGLPLEGVRVREVLGLRAWGPEVVTDSAGAFTLVVRSGRRTLVLERPGFAPLRVNTPSGDGAPVPWIVALSPSRDFLDPVLGSAPGSGEERVGGTPGSVAVATPSFEMDWPAFAVADLVEGLPGVDVGRTGLTGRRLSLRGMNGDRGGGLIFEDDRMVQLPASRINPLELAALSLLDAERVEVLPGPGSARYGPYAAGGVIRVVTSSPIDRPGGAASVGGGEHGALQALFRESVLLSRTTGLRVSGAYAKGREGLPPTADPATEDPTNSYRQVNARLDLRPLPGSEIRLAAGTATVTEGKAFTPEGALHLRDFTRSFAQIHGSYRGLLAQAYLGRGSAGSTVDAVSGNPVVDDTRLLAGEVRYGASPIPGLDLTAGLSALRSDPGTGGAIHGTWEEGDRITEVGGFAEALYSPVERVRLQGALRLDRHDWLAGVRVSPRISAVVTAHPGVTVRGSFARGYSEPAPEFLFADFLSGRIPSLGGVGFDVRTEGLPVGGLTFDDRCPGGLDNRCMYSPFLPGTRLPATGAALWDSVLVPRALQSPTLLSILTSLGISPKGFAQIVSRPSAADMGSRVLRWTGQETGKATFEPAQLPASFPRLSPAATETWEVGGRGVLRGRLALSANLFGTRIRDLVGPLEVTTPTLFLDEASVGTYLVRKLGAVGIPLPLAQQIAAEVASSASNVALGTLAADQHEGSDVVLAYRNLAPVRLWGSEVALRVVASRQVTLTGSFSYLSRNCFDLDGNGSCVGPADVSLNAPGTKESLTVRWEHAPLGVTAYGRIRRTEAFPLSMGTVRGRVDAHSAIDVNTLYDLPWIRGATVSAAVTNLLDAGYRDFVGAAEIGRMVLLRILYAF